MKNGSIRIYALAICFVSIICAAITTGFGLYNVVTLLAPQITIEPFRIDAYRSNDTFTSSQAAFSSGRIIPGSVIEPGGFIRAPNALAEPNNAFEDMSDTEITELRISRLNNELDSHRSRAILSLIKQVIIILLSSALFYAHWKLANHLGNTDNPPEKTKGGDS
jgi:hypothetical protein